jgi:hypothetical protein
VLGIDSSAKMIEQAQSMTHSSIIDYRVMDMTANIKCKNTSFIKRRSKVRIFGLTVWNHYMIEVFF